MPLTTFTFPTVPFREHFLFAESNVAPTQYALLVHESAQVVKEFVDTVESSLLVRSVPHSAIYYRPSDW